VYPASGGEEEKAAASRERIMRANYTYRVA
jgi:hypothetical protein